MQSTAHLRRSMQLLLAGPLVVAAGLAAQSSATVSLEEVARGQTGYGLSVFSGSDLERFEVEVVGVLRDFDPGRSFILARLTGQGLEQTGVIAGMSGSPVYIGDRLAGAVAFSWNFSTGALAGITPIEQMRGLSGLPEGSSGRAVGELGDLESLERLLDASYPAAALEEHLQALVPRAMNGNAPSVVFAASGFGARVHQRLAAALAPLGPLAPAGRAADGEDLPPLGPGSSVVGLLVDGDLELAVTGTVTERRGDEVLAFGHAFLGSGPMRLPMAKAEVVSVVPSQVSSFKLTNVGPVVGAFDQDRAAGLRGRIGLEAPTMELDLRVSGTVDRSFHLQVADVPAMRPSLIAVSVLQALESASRSGGDQSVEIALRFDLEGYQPLRLRQTFDGSGAATSAAIYLLQMVGFVELNSLADVDTRKLTVELHQSEEPRQVTLLNAYPDQREVRPGDDVELRLELRDWRSTVFSHTTSFHVPEDTPEGPYYLFVGDGSSVDAARLRMEPFEPRSFEQSLELLGSYLARDQLAILAVRGPARGLVVDGRSLPNLPGSVRSIWRSARRTETKALGLEIKGRKVEHFGRPLNGLVRVDLRIVQARD